ncbi:MAG: hypothetical protein KBA30_05030 [Clostridia bacterium]|nr:hypothetical protein [Clostridia bacterium]
MRVSGLLRGVTRISIPIIAMFFILTGSIGMFLNLLYEQEYLHRMGRGFYNDSAVFFMFPDDVIPDPVDPLGWADIEGQTDYLLIGTLEEVRTVFYKGQVELPPLTWGRFLESGECTDGSLRVVAGSARLGESAAAGDEGTIPLFDDEYDVIGIAGSDQPSQIDDLFFVGLGSVPPERAVRGRFYINAPDPESVFAALVDQAVNSGLPAPIRLERPTEPIDILAPNLTFGRLYLLILTGILVLSCAILMIVWVGKNRRTIAIYRLVGYGHGRLLASILSRYAWMALSGILLAILLQGLLHVSGLYSIRTDFVRQALGAAALTFLSGLLLLIPALIRVFRTEVVAVLR